MCPFVTGPWSVTTADYNGAPAGTSRLPTCTPGPEQEWGLAVGRMMIP